MHPFPISISRNYFIIANIDTQILAMSMSGVDKLLQFPTINCCRQPSHVYLCEKVRAINKNLTSTCLGALYKQQFDLARELSPMKIITSHNPFLK